MNGKPLKAQFELSAKKRMIMINQKKEQLNKQAQNEKMAEMRSNSIYVKESPKISDNLKKRIHYKATKQVEELLHCGKHPSEVHMRTLGGLGQCIEVEVFVVFDDHDSFSVRVRQGPKPV